MKKCFLFSIIFAIANIAFGFSAYENFLRTADETHAALIAKAKPEKIEALDSTLSTLGQGSAAKALKREGVSNLSVYKRDLGGDEWYMVYFDYSGEDYLQAADSFDKSTKAVDWGELVESHSRAGRYGNTWLQMEWICFIRGAKTAKKASKKYAMVTRIKPEREMDYRLYHQSVWPGVSDQMARGNNRNFSIYLVEIEDEIYEFFYVEYCGDDPQRDGKLDKTDPANQRWWSYTDKCQQPLPGEEGIWSMMEKVE